MVDSVNTYQEPEPESQEHVQEMLNKELNPQDVDRPEWLPEKFKTVEDMAKAYSQLESRLGQGEAAQEETEDASEDTEYTGTETASEVAELLDSRGLDFDAFQQEYAETGELSADAYAALEEAGFSESMVNSWIAGQDALAAQMTADVQSMVGGNEAYTEMVTWASQNLPSEEIDAFNATMDTQDANIIRLAVQGLYARYRSEAEPSLMQGGTGAVSTGGKFESTAELTAAMSDPRYAKDPAYRQTVADKLAKSSLF
jgi:YesN/AraC family two-component response regulator